MAISYNTEVYKTHDLCSNIVDLLNANISRIKFENTYIDDTIELTPTVYFSQPHIDAEYPAIFVYPKNISDSEMQGYNVKETKMIIIVKVRLAYEYYDTTRAFTKWQEAIKYVLEGRMYIDGTATSGTTTSMTVSDLAGKYSDDHFNGMNLVTLTGTGSEQELTITDYVGATGVFSFATATAPGSDTTFKVINNINYWDEDMASDFQQNLDNNRYLLSYIVSDIDIAPELVFGENAGDKDIIAAEAIMTFEGVKLNGD